MARRKSSKPRRKSASRRRRPQKRRPVLRALFTVMLIGFVALLVYVAWLDNQVRQQFEGKRWALPAQVYARPLELYPGQALTVEQLQAELQRLGYREHNRPHQPGTYAWLGRSLVITTRSFDFWDGREPSRTLRVEFSRRNLSDIRRADNGDVVDLVRLDPSLIGRIYPAHKEDRVLVRLDEVPPLLIDALLTVEDRDFYQHHGVSPRAIGRALWANLRAGHTVQGGSTLTQQLVKNFFLSNERTLTRKLNEAIMALLLEWRYDKDEILEAYLNEIYLGQDGRRAIHGFGLASQFYFERPLRQLKIEQITLLVALVKGPSYYDPRRFPARASERRDLVLRLMTEQGMLDSAYAEDARGHKPGVTPRAASGVTRLPAFMDLVRRQLRRDYSDEDLRSEGLRIFTSLDPEVQQAAELALSGQLARLPGEDLQGGLVTVDVNSGEVLAVVGGRDPRFAGFNRALDAQRPIGSLVKPAIYLTALARGDYTLATLLDDGPLSLDLGAGETWQPRNFDHLSHGQVPLFQALGQSYNQATARLGLALGVPAVLDTLQALGIERELPAWPAQLLGIASLSPLEVAQMYHTLAAGGFRTPLRAIRAVLTPQGEPLQRYPLEVVQAAPALPVFLLDAALVNAVRHGTGEAAYRSLPESLIVAGKTGTTNDLRDSWFAGFSGDRLAVVWLGRDDNRPAGLTGARGALRVWADTLRRLDVQSFEPPAPLGIEWVWVDAHTGLRIAEDCSSAVRLPFAKGTAPRERVRCAD
ncbi:MAG: penicillin-binding protein 1B [Gammaproteobacteria bacterium]|nr:penicillin-binding protein 1B [Gammaproteobacteria bacterium]MCF6361775.1 penicillin-binding protein 1B [Gammaproteobacteria bacterium]